MIAVDTETTGMDPNKNSILSLGAIDFENPTNQFYDECRAWDGAHIEEEALRINGFSKAEATDVNKKTEAELIKAFVAWAVDCKGWNFVGQNVFFDLGFVRAACARVHIDFPFPTRIIDTHTLAYMHISKRGLTPPGNPHKHHSDISLDYVLSYCGIPAETKPHNALTGALCHAEVASRLLYDRPLLPAFDMFPIPWHTIPRT